MKKNNKLLLSTTITSVLFFLFFTFSVLLITKHTHAPIHDQGAAILFDFKKTEFPGFFRGIGIIWITGIYNAMISPSLNVINVHFKLLAMAFFTVTSFLLALRILNKKHLLLAFVTVLFASRYPYLWLSTELFTAGFFNLVVYFYYQKRFNAGLGVLIALFSTIKVELFFMSLVLIVYLELQKDIARSEKLKILSGYLGTLGAVHGIGLFIKGPTYLTEYSDRGLMAIFAHYGEVFLKHQIGLKDFDPYMNTGLVFEKFPLARSAKDFLLHYPSHYIDFLAMTITRSLKRLASVYQFLLLLVPLRLILRYKYSLRWSELERFILVSLIGLLPIIATGFVHARYFARYFPAVLILMLLTVDLFQTSKAPKWLKKGAFITLWAGMLTQCIVFIVEMARIDQNPDFWFPD